MALNFISLTIYGLKSPYKRRSMWQEAKQLKADMLCVQETHFIDKKQPKCTDKLFPNVFTASASTKKQGVLLAIKHLVAFQLHNIIKDKEGRYIILICDLYNVTYTLVNLYAPNSGQLPFIRSLKKREDKIKKGFLLYCGDFNCVVNKIMDCSSPHQSAQCELQPFLNSAELYDPWRCINSTEKYFTYYSVPHKSYSRIDLFVSDLSLLQMVSAHIHSITLSDHSPVSLCIKQKCSVTPVHL